MGGPKKEGEKSLLCEVEVCLEMFRFLGFRCIQGQRRRDWTIGSATINSQHFPAKTTCKETAYSNTEISIYLE